MIRKSGDRFSEKIMLKQKDRASEIEGDSPFVSGERFAIVELAQDFYFRRVFFTRTGTHFARKRFRRDRHGAATPSELRILRQGPSARLIGSAHLLVRVHVLRDCVETKLHDVCPNCGGGFVPRPIRPAREWRPGACVSRQLPSDKRVHLKYSLEDIAAHSAGIRDIPPEKR
jgi:hypothetical protein